MMAAPTAARRRRLVAAAAALLALAAAGLVGSLPDAGAWAVRNPSTTALIEQRRAEARAAHRPYHPTLAWVPLGQVSPRLVEAVVASEDAKFFTHGGFDWEALRGAAADDLARHRFARGASTITQQLAKNLYLGTAKTLLRKLREALLTVALERRLGKRRILALYLNVAEWGDGVFGVEAAARLHLGTDAARLSTAQACLLAAMLPAPRRASLVRPPRWLALRARHLLDRLRDEGTIGAEEHASASAELERLLAGPAPIEERGDQIPDEDAPAPIPPPGSSPAVAEPGPPPSPPAASPSPPAAGLPPPAPGVPSVPGPSPAIAAPSPPPSALPAAAGAAPATGAAPPPPAVGRAAPPG